MNPQENKNVLMAAIAYLGPLVIISYIMAKDDQFVKFHIKQALVLVVIEVVIWFLGMMFYGFWYIFGLVNLATFILSIMGIVNAVGKNQKELPLVGQYANHFKF